MTDNTPQAKKEWRPRLSVEMPPELFEQFNTLIPYGARKEFVIALMRDVLSWIAEGDNRQIIVGGIMTGHMKFTNILRKASDGNNR